MIPEGERKALRTLATWFPLDCWPSLTCPTCGRGELNPGSIKERETQKSLEARSHECWEPEWISGFFYGELSCSHASCKEPVITSGEIRVERASPKYDEHQEYAMHLRPRHFMPPLKFINFPLGCPAVVKDRVSEASSLIYMDLSSSANRIRVAIEDLLTEQGVDRYPGGDETKKRLTTDARIRRFKAQNDEAGTMLMAIKWIGNVGSHEGVGLTIDNVFEAFDFLSHALDLIYPVDDAWRATLLKRAHEINAQKGP